MKNVDRGNTVGQTTCSMSHPFTHLEVHFSGRVQGVGFRYATYQVAKEFSVCGEVKNLEDGRVRLVAEGEPSEVRAFLDEGKKRLSPFIRQCEAHKMEGAGRYQGFTITH